MISLQYSAYRKVYNSLKIFCEVAMYLSIYRIYNIKGLVLIIS